MVEKKKSGYWLIPRFNSWGIIYILSSLVNFCASTATALRCNCLSLYNIAGNRVL